MREFMQSMTQTNFEVILNIFVQVIHLLRESTKEKQIFLTMFSAKNKELKKVAGSKLQLQKVANDQIKISSFYQTF